MHTTHSPVLFCCCILLPALCRPYLVSTNVEPRNKKKKTHWKPLFSHCTLSLSIHNKQGNKMLYSLSLSLSPPTLLHLKKKTINKMCVNCEFTLYNVNTPPRHTHTHTHTRICVLSSFHILTCLLCQVTCGAIVAPVCP